MKPIKRLSFDRFKRIMKSYPEGISFGKPSSYWGKKYHIEINEHGAVYELYKNNGSFMEWFFDIGFSNSILFRYFSELDGEGLQEAYEHYQGTFTGTTNMLTLSKKLAKELPEKAKWTLGDFDDLLSEFIKFIESED